MYKPSGHGGGGGGFDGDVTALEPEPYYDVT
jgi:hypothetical protein